MKYQFESTPELLEFLNEQLISSAEAAKLLDVSKARIGHMVRDGKLSLAKERPMMFLKDVVLERKKDQKVLRKKYRPYDE